MSDFEMTVLFETILFLYFKTVFLRTRRLRTRLLHGRSHISDFCSQTSQLTAFNDDQKRFIQEK